MTGFLSQSLSSPLWNETRAAGLHYFIEPLSSLNSIDFVKRVFRKGGDVEILPRAGRSSGRGKQSRATLHRPSQQHLCRRLSNSCGNCRNDWIFERPRPYSVTQWRKSQKHDVLLLAEFQKLRFRQIRMCFDLDHGRLDSRRFVNGQQFVQADIRQSDGPAFATGPPDSPSPARYRAKSRRGRKGYCRFDPADPARPPVETQMECE